VHEPESDVRAHPDDVAELDVAAASDVSCCWPATRPLSIVPARASSATARGRCPWNPQADFSDIRKALGIGGVYPGA
jgi:hypothetical protein